MRDRFDGEYMGKVDGMHFIMPFIFPNRCDNETFFSFKVDLTNLNRYLEEKNASHPDYKYNMYQAIVTACLKTIHLRSKLNIFIHDKRMYRRKEVTAAFTVKQEFADDGGEVLAFIHSKPEWTFEDVHENLKNLLLKLKSKGYSDESSSAMDILARIPKFISRPIVRLLCLLEKLSLCPKSLLATDPYHSSVLLANLGSIGLPSGFHHLSNWGTTSLFLVVGKAERMPFYENDQIVFRDGVELGFTVDERVADGYYFSRSISLFKLLLEQPELLDRPMNEKLSDELWGKVTKH